MIRDIVRTVCAVAALAAACSLVVETRERLAVIDLAHRRAVTWQAAPAGYVQAPVEPAPATPGPLARLGQATLGWADAALGVVR